MQLDLQSINTNIIFLLFLQDIQGGKNVLFILNKNLKLLSGNFKY